MYISKQYNDNQLKSFGLSSKEVKILVEHEAALKKHDGSLSPANNWGGLSDDALNAIEDIVSKVPLAEQQDLPPVADKKPTKISLPRYSDNAKRTSTQVKI